MRDVLRENMASSAPLSKKSSSATSTAATHAAVEVEAMDYLEFIARVTSHIPDKGQVMVRYYGL